MEGGTEAQGLQQTAAPTVLGGVGVGRVGRQLSGAQPWELRIQAASSCSSLLMLVLPSAGLGLQPPAPIACSSGPLSQRPIHCWLLSPQPLSSSCLLGLSCHSQGPDFFHIPQFKRPRIPSSGI